MLNVLCPICKKPLSETDGSAVCQGGHVFDCAKEGYYYLLPPKSNAPGDNAEMVRARRDFLDCGFYEPLATAIANAINERFSHSVNLVDAGTGTGYYLSKIMDSRKDFSDSYVALDISKTAVKICAKRNKSAECIVASVYDYPLRTISPTS